MQDNYKKYSLGDVRRARTSRKTPQHRREKLRVETGFALPMILISAITMIIVLLSAVTAGVSINSALNGQYYTGVANEAAESGVVMAQACLQQTGRAQWTNAKPLKPNTDCAGNETTSCSGIGPPACFVLSSQDTRSSFEVGVTTNADGGVNGLDSKGLVQQIRTSNGAVWATFSGFSKAAINSNGGVVTTLAGSGTAGFANGTGSSAQFNFPRGVAVDSSGTVYVADRINNRIRKITPAGVVTTLAGSGTAGFANGTGTAAQFYYPSGVAVDSSNTVYVADTENNRIRKITPGGVVTTLAGSGASGFANGTGTAAQFYSPIGVAVDSSGTVYVADYYNDRIRKITPAGVVTTLAGSTAGFANGTGTAAQFNTPVGVAVDSSNTVYVGDRGNQRIRKITPGGVVTTLAGSGTAGFADGAASSAQFNYPFSVAVDSSGTVYVADGSNHRIRNITPAGFVTTLAGSGTAGFADGAGSSALFSHPHGLAVDSFGTVYVGDYDNSRIRKIQ